MCCGQTYLKGLVQRRRFFFTISPQAVWAWQLAYCGIVWLVLLQYILARARVTGMLVAAMPERQCLTCAAAVVKGLFWLRPGVAAERSLPESGVSQDFQ